MRRDSASLWRQREFDHPRTYFKNVDLVGMNPNATTWQPPVAMNATAKTTAVRAPPRQGASPREVGAATNKSLGKAPLRRQQPRMYHVQVEAPSSSNMKGKKQQNRGSQDKKLAMQMFTYEEVGKANSVERDTSSTGWSAPKGGSQVKYKGPKMTRAQYCLANNRFLMSPGMNQSSESLYDPDIGLPWEFVESVSNSDKETHCSICLGNLNLPVATVCGHVFCRICVLRYLFYDSEGSHAPPSQKCPLCNSHISLKDLRQFSFEPLPITPYRFRLMCMERGSMFAQMQPRSGCKGGKGGQKGGVASGIPLQTSADARFSRVVMGSAESAQRHITEERESLLAFHQACIRAGRSEASMFDVDSQADVEHLPMIAQALELLQERETSLIGKASGGTSSSPSVAALLAASAEEVERTLNPDFPALGASGGPKGKDEEEKSTAAGKEKVKEEEALQVPLDNENGMYFYQCDSGAFVFLHPLCMKALLTDAEKRAGERGAKALPSLLTTFKVLEQESIRIDASARSRIPYLRHLPEHCDLVYLVEIDMASTVLPETYALFSDELQKRKLRRKKAKQAQQKEKRSDLDREIAQNVQREEMRERHRELVEKEARDLEALRRGPRAGKGKGGEGEGEDEDEDEEEWPSGGITAVVENYGEMHSYRNISSTMGYFPELGSTPPPPSVGAWARPSGSRSSSFEEPGSQSQSQSQSQSKKKEKGGKKDKGEKMDLAFSFT